MEREIMLKLVDELEEAKYDESIQGIGNLIETFETSDKESLKRIIVLSKLMGIIGNGIEDENLFTLYYVLLNAGAESVKETKKRRGKNLNLK